MKDKNNQSYTSKRWTDIPIPKVIGQSDEFTPEQKKQYDQDLEGMMKEYGILDKQSAIQFPQ